LALANDSWPLAKSFDDFRQLAGSDSLDKSVKTGDPTGLRVGAAPRILSDMIGKLRALDEPNQLIVDIGAGCGEVALELIGHCKKKESTLILSDAVEVLEQLPNGEHLIKIPGQFPIDFERGWEEYLGKIDAVIVYSVFHYVFPGSDFITFFDRCLTLLNEGGALSLGDIPNASMRRRFLASRSGREFHKKYMKTSEAPVVRFNALELGEIDDSLIFGILSRARAAGFHAYVLPQPSDLPFANRREDVVVMRP
jgi:hypothetical protein